jgi:hypothetical protein
MPLQSWSLGFIGRPAEVLPGRSRDGFHLRRVVFARLSVPAASAVMYPAERVDEYVDRLKGGGCFASLLFHDRSMSRPHFAEDSNIWCVCQITDSRLKVSGADVDSPRSNFRKDDPMLPQYSSLRPRAHFSTQARIFPECVSWS